MRIAPLEPPLRVAWDPVPRTEQEATVAIVRSDDGIEGYGSGDPLPDRELLERLLVGVDPLRGEVVRELCETVDFHGSRPWPCEVAAPGRAERAAPGLRVLRRAGRSGGAGAPLPGASRCRRARGQASLWRRRL